MKYNPKNIQLIQKKSGKAEKKGKRKRLDKQKVR